MLLMDIWFFSNNYLKCSLFRLYCFRSFNNISIANEVDAAIASPKLRQKKVDIT